MKDSDMIYSLLKEVRADQKEQGKELAKQSVSLANVEKHVEKNTRDLEYHIKRTDGVQENHEILTKLHTDNENRIKANEDNISELQEPGKARAYIKKNWQFYTGIVIVVLSIASMAGKIAELFK